MYVATRAQAERLAGELANRRPSWAYHGGLPRRARDDVLRAFREADEAIVVATTAFGMGIDIGDIDTVAHLDLPPTLVDYYQEIGRAGRDGRAAQARAFVGARKRSRRAFAGGVRRVDPDTCLAVHRAAESGTLNRRTLASALDLTAGEVTRALAILESLGAVATRPRLRVTGPDPASDDLEAASREFEEFDRAQRQAIARYRTADTCRWLQILAALGQASGPCGAGCDVCVSGDVEPEGRPIDGGPAVAGSMAVVHATFGPGVVATIDDGIATIVFDRAGPKALDWELCLAEGLLDLPEG